MQIHWHKLTYTFTHTYSAKVKYLPVLYFFKLQRLSVCLPPHWAGLIIAEITNVKKEFVNWMQTHIF